MITLNPDSELNSVSNEIKYCLALPGKGYLSNATNWTDTLDEGGVITSSNFNDVDGALFDEPPTDLIERSSPAISGNLVIVRRMSTHVYEEVESLN